jgi:hypothetical protein
MGERFFLSHSTADKPLVLRVDRALRALGFDVWTDKFEIKIGDSLVRKVFDEGLSSSDYVCAFLTENSVKSRWVQEELEFAFVRAMREGKPKILLLQFDNVEVPNVFKSKRYAPLERHELGEIVEAIAASAGITLVNPEHAPTPYAANDFHDALQDGDVVYLLASRRDELDVDPFYDPEGIEFKRRHIYVLRLDTRRRDVRSHYLSKGRPAHTAMRIVGDDLLIFINDKVVNNDFDMEGRLFRVKKSDLRPHAVSSVFSGENWGWDPWIDEQGRLHHKDSETAGNPYRLNKDVAEGKSWRELSEVQKRWRLAHCPFDTAYGPGRETGYLRFLNVDPGIFQSLHQAPPQQRSAS